MERNVFSLGARIKKLGCGGRRSRHELKHKESQLHVVGHRKYVTDAMRNTPVRAFRKSKRGLGSRGWFLPTGKGVGKKN